MPARRAAVLLLTIFLTITIPGCGGGGAASAPVATTPTPPPVSPPAPPTPTVKFPGIFRASGTPGYGDTGKASTAPVLFAFARPAAAMAGLGAASLTMSENRQNHAATLLQDGRVLITGGSKLVPITNGAQMVSLDSADIYDPTSRGFTRSKHECLRSAPNTGLY